MRTPLHEAAAAGHVAALEKLVELGADVNATCAGDFTPLHLAAMRGQAGAVASLVRLRSCLWARDWLFRTPLQVADYWNKSGVVQALGRAMGLANDPSVEVCGGWWHRHVVACDMSYAGRYDCWCSACHCPSPEGEKDSDFLNVKYGWDPDLVLRPRDPCVNGGVGELGAQAGSAAAGNASNCSPAKQHGDGMARPVHVGGGGSPAAPGPCDKHGRWYDKFTLQDDFDMHAPEELDFRHVTRLHPIYNATWNALAKARWQDAQGSRMQEAGVKIRSKRSSPGLVSPQGKKQRGPEDGEAAGKEEERVREEEEERAGLAYGKDDGDSNKPWARRTGDCPGPEEVEGEEEEDESEATFDGKDEAFRPGRELPGPQRARGGGKVRVRPGRGGRVGRGRPGRRSAFSAGAGPWGQGDWAEQSESTSTEYSQDLDWEDKAAGHRCTVVESPRLLFSNRLL